MSTKLQIPAGLQGKTAGDRVTVTGPKGVVERKVTTRNMDLKIAGNEV